MRDIEKYKVKVILKEGERSLRSTIHKTVADTGSRGYRVRWLVLIFQLMTKSFEEAVTASCMQFIVTR